MRCLTHWLTCARCLRDAVQRPDLPQLESGLHFMTAVRVHVDQMCRKYDRWQNPKGSARVYAWAYSSGHCRISHQVSLWICSLVENCVTVLKIDRTQVQWSDDEFKHLTNVPVWVSHNWLGWEVRVFSWTEGERCGLKPVCPALNTLQWSAVCMPVSKASRTLPSLSVYFS